MSWLVQDLIVSVFALGAAGILVRRVAGLFRPSSTDAACTACPSCPTARKTPATAGSTETTGVPIAIVNLRTPGARPGG